eukprot:gnl/TRDRNA2_/TRDRNA2_94903_c0_seq1.p1 gnl/TRDRNA2_/TRDRNA2_94903_c0~~gnl/TRDRNA2_/TRDRNA2_94903_c0_seq1.p1  ORF type:complete len:320 (+),score=62.41 gnl/TRDRNA2_/TRDRNA2_94903_c0_seq1:46-1005(+)
MVRLEHSSPLAAEQRAAAMHRVRRLSEQLLPEPVASQRLPPPPRVVVEFFFDTSSPWTYMAFTRIREVCAKTGAELVFKPILVGGVFNVANKSLYAARDAMMAKTDKSKPNAGRQEPSAKEKWAAKNAKAWADYMGLNIRSMAERFNARMDNGAPGHPISAVKMLRGLILAQEEGQEAMIRFAFASFDAYWGTLRDVSKDATLHDIHSEAGLKIGFQDFLRRLDDDDVKAKLRNATDELVRRGGFGSPTIFVSRPDGPAGFAEEMLFGNDNMELVEAAVLRAQGRPWRFHDTYGIARAHPAPQNLLRGEWARLDTDGER